MKNLRILSIFATLALLVGCNDPIIQEWPEPEEPKPEKPSETGKLDGFSDPETIDLSYLEGEGDEPTPADSVDIIPDFSRTGYKYGDEAIPDVAVVQTVNGPSGGDDTKLIQDAIDAATGPGAVLLKNGTYRVSGIIFLDKSGIVLRGESRENTVILATGTDQRPLIHMGKSSSRAVTESDEDGTKVLETKTTSRKTNSPSEVIEDYVPVGRMYVRVKDPLMFQPGDRVCIYRPGTDNWIHAIKMDSIEPRADGGTVNQWTAAGYNFYWNRVVTKVTGTKVWFDNPVVMALDKDYGGGSLMKYVWDRTEENGVENISLDSEYDANVKSTTGITTGIPYCADEKHAWTGIVVKSCVNGWVRNVSSRHFGFGLVNLDNGALQITVENCRCTDPISIITGSRRYAFEIGAGECCLIKDCSCDSDRHQFATSSKVCGPNAFLRGSATKSYNSAGPHHRWANGLLYDNMNLDRNLNVYDTACEGSGHGWNGANTYFWNCTADYIVCNSPWTEEGHHPSALNYCIGCICTHMAIPRTYADGLIRPDGVWMSHNTKVTSGVYFSWNITHDSLYETQKAARQKVTITQ